MSYKGLIDTKSLETVQIVQVNYEPIPKGLILFIKGQNNSLGV